MATNFANGVASYGMPILPVQLPYVGGGNVFWVDSGYAGGASNGSFTRPFTTLALAVASGKLLGSNGDIIYIKPGHTESIAAAAGITLSHAGLSVIGLGRGTLRPTFTWTTGNTSTIVVSAADVLVANIVCKANFDTIASAFALSTAKNFCLKDVEFGDTSTTDVSFADLVDLGTTDNAADGLTLDGVKWVSEDDATVTMVDVDATVDSMTIRNCFVKLATATQGIVATVAADKQLTNLVIENNKLDFEETDATGGLLVTGTCASSYGVVCRNMIQALDAAGAIFFAAATTPIMMADNWYTGSAAEPLALATVGGTAYNDA